MSDGTGRRRALLPIAIAAATPAFSQGGGPAVLDRLERGLWELRDLNEESVLHASVCLGDPMLLVQTRHGDAPCSHKVISSTPQAVTVHYTCPSAGFGRTTIRYETPRLAQVDSQGIYRNAPFGFRAEARKTGPCAGR